MLLFRLQKTHSIFKITDLEQRFADYREYVDARISILESENDKMKFKISTMDSIGENNAILPVDEPCGYPCAQFISRIESKVSLCLTQFNPSIDF